MTLVTADDAELFPRWTVDDLAHLPEDGNRYELLNGELIVSPAPVPLHTSGGQRIRLDHPYPVEICPAETVDDRA